MNVKCLIVKDWTIFTIFTIHNIKFQVGEGVGGLRSGQPLLKYFLKCLLNDKGKPQKHLSFEKIRFLNIIHIRLGHNCTLNSDLFRCNLIASLNCSCRLLEDAYHL